MWKRFAQNLAVLLATIAVTVGFGEWSLGLFGFSAEHRPRLAHPPNYAEVRKNIEFTYTFKTNSLGLRDDEIGATKARDEYRVYVAGDSFVEGFGVEKAQRFTDLLQSRFSVGTRLVRFVNGGLGGTGPLEYGRLFLSMQSAIKPDALLICLYANDPTNTPEQLDGDPFDLGPARYGPLRSAIHRLAPRTSSLVARVREQLAVRSETRTTNFQAEAESRAIRRGISADRIEEWKRLLPQDLVKATNEGRFVGAGLSAGLFNPTYWTDSLDVNTAQAEHKFSNMTVLLSTLVAKARSAGIEVAVVLVPVNFAYDRSSHDERNIWRATGTAIDRRWLDGQTRAQSRIESWAMAERVRYLDLTDAFRVAATGADQLNYPKDGHWNSLGHAVAARVIGDWLIAQQVFPSLRAE